MNIVEALEVALPPLPARHAPKRLPRVEANLLAHEDLEGGVPTVLVMKPGSDGFYRLSPQQWELLQLCDGRRSLAQIAEQFQGTTGTQCAEEDVRELVDFLSATDLLYKPASERIGALADELRRQRRHSRKSRFGDVSEIQIFSFDPDAILTSIYPYLRFIYIRWFTLLTVALFFCMGSIFVANWGEIWRDTGTYYTFSQKGFHDLAEFWVLLFLIAIVHETAHGLTCKHFGGGVHRMGFLLMYSLPCFFCDTTEAWVHTGRTGRILTMLAGIWVELTVCAFATLTWWGTSPGSWVHDMAYKIILFTGIAVVVLNINPLIKLDGYFIFCELIGIGDLKEKSTAYTSSWVRGKVFGLPVEVEYVPPRRRPLFIGYALASGAYSYGLLLALIGFSNNVLRAFSPEWAFLPVLAIAYVLFKSRLVMLERFMRTVYLDKKGRLGRLFRGRPAVITAMAAALLLAPFWPVYVQGRFELRAHDRAVVRTAVGGSVARVFVAEGQAVSAGAPLLRLRNLALESEAAQAQADLSSAQARAFQAELRYSGWAPADQYRRQLAERKRLLQQQMEELELASPISGTITTPRVGDLEGSFLQPGTTVLEIADLSTLEARVYLSEQQMRDLHPQARTELHLDSSWRTLSGSLAGVAPASTHLAPGLSQQQQSYKGLEPPPYYVAWVNVSHSPELLENMSGTAKIFVRRESIIQAAGRTLRDVVTRKVW